MCVAALLLFLGTVAVAAVFGSRARARFLMLLRDRHPDLYEQLGSPPIWVSTSLLRGLRVQRLVFSEEPKLCAEAEAARGHLRRVTVAVIAALVAECALMMWAFGRAG